MIIGITQQDMECKFENDIININPLSKVKYPSSINKKFKKLAELEETEIHPFNKDEIYSSVVFVFPIHCSIINDDSGYKFFNRSYSFKRL